MDEYLADMAEWSRELSYLAQELSDQCGYVARRRMKGVPESEVEDDYERMVRKYDDIRAHIAAGVMGYCERDWRDIER